MWQVDSTRGLLGRMSSLFYRKGRLLKIWVAIYNLEATWLIARKL